MMMKTLIKDQWPWLILCFQEMIFLQKDIVQPNFDGIFTETKAKLLLSSATVALDNANCHIPIFIQVHNKDKDLFLGVCEHTNVRTYFDVAFLRRTPHIYKDLSGLTDLFKSKLCQQSMVHDNLNVLLSAKLTYTLSNWIDHPWPQDMENFMGEVGVTRLEELPCGACEDPVSQLNLYATWISYPLRGCSRNLKPHDAPEWTANICLKPNVQCLLFEYLSDFLSLCSCKESSASVLGHEIDESDSVQNIKIAHALDKLSEPMHLPTISSVVARARTRIQVRHEESPIQTELLIKILQFIFPDAALSMPYSFNDAELVCDADETFFEKMQELLKTMKSAPISSLASRLALAMCHVHHSYGGLSGVAHLWQEFVLEMRYRWENHYMLPW
ncbi:Rab3 GTPase-activating protein catalytic subunit [Nymphon striatum]|nr:Rab3 GTPase-activating protein catalytic subunit [Nymphon striatum]